MFIALVTDWMIRQHNDTLDEYTPDGGGLKTNAHDVSDEIRALIGRATTNLLLTGNAVTLESLIQALYQLSETTGDSEIHRDCLELIQQLLKKMH